MSALAIPGAVVAAPTSASAALASPADSRSSFGAAVRAAEARVDPRPPGSPALRVLQVVEQASRRLDAVLDQARRGRTFTAGELLALQADAYRASQAIDLAARAVEQGAQAVRQAVNTQV